MRLVFACVGSFLGTFIRPFSGSSGSTFFAFFFVFFDLLVHDLVDLLPHLRALLGNLGSDGLSHRVGGGLFGIAALTAPKRRIPRRAIMNTVVKNFVKQFFMGILLIVFLYNTKIKISIPHPRDLKEASGFVLISVHRGEHESAGPLKIQGGGGLLFLWQTNLQGRQEIQERNERSHEEHVLEPEEVPDRPAQQCHSHGKNMVDAYRSDSDG